MKIWENAEFAECHTDILLIEEEDNQKEFPRAGEIYKLENFKQFEDDLYLFLPELGRNFLWNSVFFRPVKHGNG